VEYEDRGLQKYCNKEKTKKEIGTHFRLLGDLCVIALHICEMCNNYSNFFADDGRISAGHPDRVSLALPVKIRPLRATAGRDGFLPLSCRPGRLLWGDPIMEHRGTS